MQGLASSGLVSIGSEFWHTQVNRLVIAILEVGACATKCREAGRPCWHDHVLEAHALRVAIGVNWTRAAVREAGELDRVVAASADVCAKVFAQGQVEQLDHACSRVFNRQTQRISHLRLNVIASALNVELDSTAQEVFWVEVTQNHVAVRHRHGSQTAFWPAGTDAIACAIWAQLDGLAVRVNAHEATSASTHRVHGHQRQRENQASHVRVGLDREVTLGDQRHVEARATNVGASNVLVAESVAKQLRTDHTADWSGNDGTRQLLSLPADGAAVRCHHAKCKLCTVLHEAISDQLERCTRWFCAVGFQNRRVHAVTFLARRIVVNRREHWNRRAHLRELFLDDVAGTLLARAVLVSLQETDHDGLGASLDQFLGCNAHFVFTKRNHDLALNVRTLSDTAGARDRYQWLVVPVGIQVNTVFQSVPKVALQSTAHRVNLLKATVAHQTHIEALALQHAVQHGGARIDARHQLRVNIINRATPVSQSVN